MIKFLLGKPLFLTGLIFLLARVGWSQDSRLQDNLSQGNSSKELFAKRSSIAVPSTQQAPVQSLVKGTVTSQTEGEALPGVSIVIKGTTKGTTTDLDGKYSITASSGLRTVFEPVII